MGIRPVHILDVLMARYASSSRMNGGTSRSVGLGVVFVALLFAIIGMQNGTDDASPASPRARHENSQTSHGEFSSTKSTADKCSDMANSYRTEFVDKCVDTKDPPNSGTADHQFLNTMESHRHCVDKGGKTCTSLWAAKLIVNAHKPPGTEEMSSVSNQMIEEKLDTKCSESVKRLLIEKRGHLNECEMKRLNREKVLNATHSALLTQCQDNCTTELSHVGNTSNVTVVKYRAKVKEAKLKCAHLVQDENRRETFDFVLSFMYIPFVVIMIWSRKTLVRFMCVVLNITFQYAFLIPCVIEWASSYTACSVTILFIWNVIVVFMITHMVPTRSGAWPVEDVVWGCTKYFVYNSPSWSHDYYSKNKVLILEANDRVMDNTMLLVFLGLADGKLDFVKHACVMFLVCVKAYTILIPKEYANITGSSQIKQAMNDYTTKMTSGQESECVDKAYREIEESLRNVVLRNKTELNAVVENKTDLNAETLQPSIVRMVELFFLLLETNPDIRRQLRGFTDYGELLIIKNGNCNNKRRSKSKLSWAWLKRWVLNRALCVMRNINKIKEFVSRFSK